MVICCRLIMRSGTYIDRAAPSQSSALKYLSRQTSKENVLLALNTHNNSGNIVVSLKGSPQQSPISTLVTNYSLAKKFLLIEVSE